MVYHLLCKCLISIHVPAWGTTNTGRYVILYLYYFNPRSRVGNDIPIKYSTTATINFNPRSRVGNDGCKSRCYYLRQYFNPRSRVGNDGNRAICQCGRNISIHVPAWGTTAFEYMLPHCHLFQSTFPRGERREVMHEKII